MTEEEFLKILVETEKKSWGCESSVAADLQQIEGETEMDNVPEKHELNNRTMRALVLIAKDDADLLEMMIDVCRDFMKYHNAIVELEAYAELHDYGNTDRDKYRTEYEELDATRSRCHEAVLQDVQVLNRLAAANGLEPVYDGVLSREQPYRRQIADAVMGFLKDIVMNRR